MTQKTTKQGRSYRIRTTGAKKGGSAFRFRVLRESWLSKDVARKPDVMRRKLWRSSSPQLAAS